MAQDLFGTGPRARLERAAEALRTIHRILIARTKSDYERTQGPIRGPYALFTLLAQDPSFAWLQPMTRAIVELEEVLGRKDPPVAPKDVEAARRRLEELLSTPGAAFADRYLELLQSEPLLAAEHGRLKSVLA